MNKIVKILGYLIVLLLFVNATVYSQTAKIKGTVKDADTGEPLVGANIVLLGTTYGAATDIKGNYVIIGVPPGKYKIRASYIGYEKDTVKINALASKTTIVDFKLYYSGGTKLKQITVTAQARGQLNAINEQLNSTDIKNVVSAERMQELPDANAAETLGRLPGVSVQRVGGEGSKVVIRGMAPKYNRVMIEGVNIPASGSDRSNDLSMISPYSLDGIEVMKAITADHDADFVGGSVNFKLREAEPGLKYDLIAQGGYNNLKHTYNDYMITGSISDRFFNDKLGVYLQGNLEKRNRSSNNLSASYNLRNPRIDTVNTVYTEKFTLTDAIREKNRIGLLLALDYRLPDGVIHFKNFYNNGITTVNRYGETYAVKDRTHQYQTRDEEYDLGILSNILDYKQNFGNWEIYGKISHSFTSNDVPTDLSFLYLQNNALSSDVLKLQLSPKDLVNYANINDTTTYFKTLNESYQKTKDRQIAGKVDVKYNFTITKQVNGFLKFGGKYRYKDRSFDKDVYTGDYMLSSGQKVKDAILQAFPWMQKITPLGSSLLPYILFYNPNFDHQNFLNGEYHMGPVGNIDLMHQILKVIKGVENPSLETYVKNDFYSKREDYTGNEYLYAGYLMSEINFGKHIKFIPGVRYEKNKTLYTGARGDARLPFPNQHYEYHDTTMTRINEYFLPMIHLKLSPWDWVNVKFAYTKTLSRPDFNLITPRIDILRGVVIWNNYMLRPERSENFDLYFTFHENHIGLFSVGGFTKKIKDMIFWQDKRVILDPAEYDLPDNTDKYYIYTQKNNQYDANVWGIELDWQTNFWYLPSFLKGLILNVNYTYIHSEAKYPRTVVNKKFDRQTFSYIYTNVDTFYTGPLQFQPDNVINIQLGYDYKDFSARVSMLYQSKIFQASNFWHELSTYNDPYWRWDLSVKQKLPWYGLQVFCNVNNISGEKEVTVNYGSQNPTNIQHYGMTIDFGVRVKL